jgi:hypothetical protein
MALVVSSELMGQIQKREHKRDGSGSKA